MTTTALLELIYRKGIDVGTKLLGVILLWLVGRFVIGGVKKIMDRGMRARSVDATIIGYADNVVNVLLNILLVATILGFVGVETTTFAGLLAAAGLAIGTAWSGLLANFASGAFLVILRPFKKGDFISAAGTTGTVVDIGMFVTVINTPDNVRTMVGNNKLFSDTIQNFSTNAYRRVERTAQLAHGADHKRAMALIAERVRAIPNVLSDPLPDLTLIDFNLAGPVIAVRPYCHNDHYWQVSFDTNEAIREALSSNGFEVPATHHAVSR